MAKKKSGSRITRGVFAGNVVDGDGRHELKVQSSTEVHDDRVVITNRSITNPSLATCDQISDARLVRMFAYLQSRQLAMIRAERHANRPIRSFFKTPGRRPKRLVSSQQCPDCEGATVLNGTTCVRCGGEGWIRE